MVSVSCAGSIEEERTGVRLGLQSWVNLSNQGHPLCDLVFYKVFSSVFSTSAT